VKNWAESDDDERRQILDWLVDTCLVFGSERATAYLVAAHFAQGLDAEAAK
jgi:hypothetical protein